MQLPIKSHEFLSLQIPDNFGGQCSKCEHCTQQLLPLFPMPFVLYKIEEGKKGKYRRQHQKGVRLKFHALNIRIFALNILWGGANANQRTMSFVHWRCMPDKYLKLYRNLLQCPSKVWNQPKCSSMFTRLVAREESIYTLNSASLRVSASNVSASNISLPSASSSVIPILSLLPNDICEFYMKETNIVSMDKVHWEEAASIKATLKMPRIEYVKVLIRMHFAGMLVWLSNEQVRIINGVQCVVKQNGKHRLIFDGRPVNCIFCLPAKVSLPAFNLVENWMVGKEEAVLFGKLDLENYYHRLAVPQWMHKYLAMPPVYVHELVALDSSFASLNHQLLYPCCATLPMGLSHAVILAQLVHLNLLSSLPFYSSINRVVQPIDREWVFIYIDDVILAVRYTDELIARKQLSGMVQKILDCYAKVGLTVNSEKMVVHETTLDALGCYLDGKKGTIQPIKSKLQEVVQATKYLVSLSYVKKKWIERLLGFWVWFLLLKRPLFSFLVNVYKFMHKMPHNRLVASWPSVNKEFELLICFSETCALSWRRKFDLFLMASDASLVGCGGCQIPCATPHEWVDRPIDDLAMLPWKFLMQKKWDFPEHINVLEFRALNFMLHNLLAVPHRCHSRLSVLLDSQVVHFIVRKGRSSSYLLNVQPTTALAVYIQFDCYLRPAEVCAVQAAHVLFGGGPVLGSSVFKVLIILPQTKTGPLQSVDIRRLLLQKLLHRLVKSSSPSQLLFPSYQTYAARIKQALANLGLTSIGYTPHSLRHGAATSDLLRGGFQQLSAIMYRGRWNSDAGKVYLQAGAALLLNAKLPPACMKQAQLAKQFLPSMFKGSSFVCKT